LPAFATIIFCGGDQFFFGVHHRIVNHCTRDGSCRFSGRAFHTAARSASSSSARPRRVSFCLRVSHSRIE
jgi:hypothetical protein